MKQLLWTILVLFPCLVHAQNKVLYLHPDVTTHLVLPEEITSVDISSATVALHQSSPKMLLIKPLENQEAFLGVLTVVCPSFIIQFELYPGHAGEADRLVPVASFEGMSLSGAPGELSQKELRKLSQSIIARKAPSPKASVKKQNITLSLASVRAAGDYLFLEVEIENNTQLPLHLQSLEFVLSDKSGGKRTNVQEISITPVFRFMDHSVILKHFRNVYVLKVERYPGPKLLEIRMKEGDKALNLMTLEIPYQKLLQADTF
jgi:hypothetical protein